ncbi:pli1 [Symbiodinium sp. CCMP2592]|nr:pli1 [Symbiodinium sp. CCMP2592]
MRGCVDDKLGGYHHVGTELWFPHGDYLNGVMCLYRECVGVPAGEDLSCADGLYFPQDADVLDHHGYFKVLDNGFCGTGNSTGTMHDVILV